jgi:SAM-dependent methyltransferase
MPSRLYTDYAEWWPLFADTRYYEREAATISTLLRAELGRPIRTILELGCGGGTLASFLKADAELTLIDPEPCMLAVSRSINPNCAHIAGDMRTIRLEQRFDAVVLHDAINYMASSSDLRSALATAHAHLVPDGSVIVLPDDTAETFEPSMSAGGNDGPDGRGLRYVLWTGPCRNNAYPVDFGILLREASGATHMLHERHLFGLFDLHEWNEAFRQAGFAPPIVCPDGLRQHVFRARPIQERR